MQRHIASFCTAGCCTSARIWFTRPTRFSSISVFCRSRIFLREPALLPDLLVLPPVGLPERHAADDVGFGGVGSALDVEAENLEADEVVLFALGHFGAGLQEVNEADTEPGEDAGGAVFGFERSDVLDETGELYDRARRVRAGVAVAADQPGQRRLLLAEGDVFLGVRLVCHEHHHFLRFQALLVLQVVPDHHFVRVSLPVSVLVALHFLLRQAEQSH